MGTRERFSAFVRFVTQDHRYVFLGTSVIACIGIALSTRPRSPYSFLAGAYGFEVALYWLLVAWLVLSGVALVFKLTHWETYAECSPFVRPRVRRWVRIGSYLVCAATLVLFLDRVVMGIRYVSAVAVAKDRNPNDFLGSIAYMLDKEWATIARGALNTVLLSVFGTLIAFVLAILLVFLRIQRIDRSDNDLVRFLKVVGRDFAIVYSTIVRGTPMMVQAMLIYFLGFNIARNSGMSVGEAGRVWSTFVAGLVTISLNSTAYMMEVLRGGIEAVDPGQMEAARSLGLTQWQAMIKVVFPQGIKNAIPALSNELVVNIKDSSVLSVIGVLDLMFATKTVVGIYFKQVELYVVAAVIYLCLTMVASWLLAKFARSLSVQPAQLLSTSDGASSMGTLSGMKSPGRSDGTTRRGRG